jgi:hypothetical protein
MKMEDNSYYISYHVNNCNESASFCYYYDVHKDSFSFKDYTICDSDISYEPGSWYNKSPYSFDCGTQITARKFHRWTDEIERTKKKLIELGKGAGTATVYELKEGDCVFCDIPPYDPEYEYDYEWFCFWEIISVDNDIISAKEIVIAPYSFRCSKGVTRIERSEEEYWLNDALKNGCIKLIDKSVFLRATEIFNPLPKKIMAEIKEEVECIER